MDRAIQLVYKSGKVHSLYISLFNEISPERIYNLYYSLITIFKDILASKTKWGISERKSQLFFDKECVKARHSLTEYFKSYKSKAVHNSLNLLRSKKG